MKGNRKSFPPFQYHLRRDRRPFNAWEWPASHFCVHRGRGLLRGVVCQSAYFFPFWDVYKIFFLSHINSQKWDCKKIRISKEGEPKEIYGFSFFFLSVFIWGNRGTYRAGKGVWVSLLRHCPPVHPGRRCRRRRRPHCVNIDNVDCNVSVLLEPVREIVVRCVLTLMSSNCCLSNLGKNEKREKIK